MEDRRVKVHDVAEVTDIAESTINKSIPDLKFHKVPVCRVPNLFTEEYKNKRMAAVLENLCCYKDEGE
jgi:hypothetical protein